MNKKLPTLVAFGAVIRRLRQEHCLSQEALAALCGLDRTYIGGIERGERNVSLLNLERIANAFNIAVSELLRDLK